MRQHARVHPFTQLIALGIPHRQLLFVLGGNRPRGGLFLFDLGGLGLQFGLGGPGQFVLLFGADHQLQDPVFGLADGPLGKLDLV